jgi:hypothetical protein
MSLGRPSDFAQFLDNLNKTARGEATEMMLQQVLERYPCPDPEHPSWKRLVPSVYAWQRVWDLCVQLGMKPDCQTESGELVVQFIAALAANKNGNIHTHMTRLRDIGAAAPCVINENSYHMTGRALNQGTAGHLTVNPAASIPASPPAAAPTPGAAAAVPAQS